jgi:hypothetical protein
MTLYLPYHFVLAFLTVYCCYQSTMQHFLRHQVGWNMICIPETWYAFLKHDMRFWNMICIPETWYAFLKHDMRSWNMICIPETWYAFKPRSSRGLGKAPREKQNPQITDRPLQTSNASIYLVFFFYLQKYWNKSGFFISFSYLNIMGCGLKTCSSCPTLLMFLSFERSEWFIYILGATPRICEAATSEWWTYTYIWYTFWGAKHENALTFSSNFHEWLNIC